MQRDMKKQTRPEILRRLPACILTAALILAACGCNQTREAEQQLALAQSLYESRRYTAAKNAIDTLRRQYRTEVNVMRDALKLMRLVERGESEQNIAYCDSLIPIRRHEAETLKKGFVFEKDTAWEDLGRYVWQQQNIEQNAGRSYLRCGVDEKGEIYLASVYCGARPLNHTGLRLSQPDGIFATTATIPYDGGTNYRFSDLGLITEVVTYRGRHSLSAVQLIRNALPRTRIKAEYTGGTPFSIYLTNADQDAVRATCNLAAALSDIEMMRLEKEKSAKRIQYIDLKLAEQTK